MSQELIGNYTSEMDSGYNYLRGSNVSIDCVRYSVYKELIDAITPILEKEHEEVKKRYEERK